LGVWVKGGRARERARVLGAREEPLEPLHKLKTGLAVNVLYLLFCTRRHAVNEFYGTKCVLMSFMALNIFQSEAGQDLGGGVGD